MSTSPTLGPLVIVDPELATWTRAAGIREAYPWGPFEIGGVRVEIDSEWIARHAGRDDVLIIALDDGSDAGELLAHATAREIRRAVRLLTVESAGELLELVTLDDLAHAELVEPPAPAKRWEPYPLDALPRSIADLAREGAKSIGCDPAHVALPALVVCAGAIGLSRDVRIKEGKRGWREPSVLWACIVSESGTAKSPALDLAEEPLLELEAAARRRFKRELAEWEAAVAEEKRGAKAEKRPPELPPKPTLARHVAKDATIEALAPILEGTPRGITVVRDELAAWFHSWGEYKAHASGDAAKWLELYGARALIKDRVGEGRSTFVERAAVSVVGGTQPGILRRILSPEHLESGCGARILFAMPPRLAREWREATISDATADAYSRGVRALSLLEPETVRHPDGSTSLRPVGIPLSSEARELFARWVDELGREALDYEGAEAAAASKVEGAAARIALAIELAEAADGALAWRALEAEDAALEAEARARRAAAEAELPACPVSEAPEPDSPATAPEGVPCERDADASQPPADPRLAAGARTSAEDARRAADRVKAEWGRSVREVSAHAMRNGIAVARWHWREARRVLALRGEAGEEDGTGEERRKLVEWIGCRGGEVSPADLTRGLKRFRGKGGSKLGEKALEELAELGLGEWVSEWRRRPGAPSRTFRLHSAQAEQPPGGAAEGGETGPRNGAATGSSAPQAPHGEDSPHEAEPARKRWGPGAETAS